LILLIVNRFVDRRDPEPFAAESRWKTRILRHHRLPLE
jgi:hypothetical protein